MGFLYISLFRGRLGIRGGRVKDRWDRISIGDKSRHVGRKEIPICSFTLTSQSVREKYVFSIVQYVYKTWNEKRELLDRTSVKYS